MVSTRDSESLDPGSNPGRPSNIYIYINAPLAQWTAHWTSNPGVAGSSPARGEKIYMYIYIYKRQ